MGVDAEEEGGHENHIPQPNHPPEPHLLPLPLQRNQTLNLRATLMVSTRILLGRGGNGSIVSNDLFL